MRDRLRYGRRRGSRRSGWRRSRSAESRQGLRLRPARLLVVQRRTRLGRGTAYWPDIGAGPERWRISLRNANTGEYASGFVRLPTEPRWRSVWDADREVCALPRLGPTMWARSISAHPSAQRRRPPCVDGNPLRVRSLWPIPPMVVGDDVEILAKAATWSCRKRRTRTAPTRIAREPDTALQGERAVADYDPRHRYLPLQDRPSVSPRWEPVKRERRWGPCTCNDPVGAGPRRAAKPCLKFDKSPIQSRRPRQRDWRS
jgi:hypothetical protein